MSEFQASTFISDLIRSPDKATAKSLLEVGAGGIPGTVSVNVMPETFSDSDINLIETADLPAGTLLVLTSNSQQLVFYKLETVPFPVPNGYIPPTDFNSNTPKAWIQVL
jgi:hypothetical protein